MAAANVLLSIFAIAAGKDYQKVDDIPERSNIDKDLKRTTPFLTHEVFSKYHTETEMMRYIKRLDRKDISLAQSMISLGSCTMKLNAAAEMLPLSRPEFMGMHPLVPEDQAEGYRELIKNLSEDLKVITGFAGVSHFYIPLLVACTGNSYEACLYSRRRICSVSRSWNQDFVTVSLTDTFEIGANHTKACIFSCSTRIGL